jgi:hypothetical protein
MDSFCFFLCFILSFLHLLTCVYIVWATSPLFQGAPNLLWTEPILDMAEFLQEKDNAETTGKTKSQGLFEKRVQRSLGRALLRMTSVSPTSFFTLHSALHGRNLKLYFPEFCVSSFWVREKDIVP